MLIAAVKVKSYPYNTNAYNLKVNTVVFFFKKKLSSLHKNLKMTMQQIFAYHGFLKCEKFECLKFRHTEVIHKNLFVSFVEMHSCV